MALNDNKKNVLPPIVVDYVEKLANPRAPAFQRDLYCMNLERIRDACDNAIKAYKKEIEKFTLTRRK